MYCGSHLARGAVFGRSAGIEPERCATQHGYRSSQPRGIASRPQEVRETAILDSPRPMSFNGVSAGRSAFPAICRRCSRPGRKTELLLRHLILRRRSVKRDSTGIGSSASAGAPGRRSHATLLLHSLPWSHAAQSPGDGPGEPGRRSIRFRPARRYHVPTVAVTIAPRRRAGRGPAGTRGPRPWMPRRRSSWRPSTDHGRRFRT